MEEEEIGSVSVPCEISSKKLRDLGFDYKFGSVEDIVQETIASCLHCGFLPHLHLPIEQSVHGESNR